VTTRREPEVHRITAAPEPLGVDVARRQQRYLIQMGIRIVCFVLSVLTWSHVPPWVSLVLIVAAVVLPYVAVILANAGRERRDEPEPFVDPRMIGGGHRPDELGDGR
jgi:Flp pilus assembly protein TadB